jgi:hypothetical protein
MKHNYVVALIVVVLAATSSLHSVDAFACFPQISTSSRATTSKLLQIPSTTLYAIGPIARAKKMMDPQDYKRVVEQKMKQEGLSRQQTEDEYNAFLENPSFYYALDKKEEYYKSLGYKDSFEGMIGEAEKEGRGDEVRERIAKFRQTNRIKAYSVLAVFILSFCYLYNIYHEDPSSFLSGLPVREIERMD